MLFLFIFRGGNSLLYEKQIYISKEILHMEKNTNLAIKIITAVYVVSFAVAIKLANKRSKKQYLDGYKDGAEDMIDYFQTQVESMKK